MVKIYTKTGDLGTTALFGGRRVDKNSLRIEAIGNIDELNALIGLVVAENPPPDVNVMLRRIHDELLTLGSDIASPLNIKVKTKRITKPFITRLEKEIDKLMSELFSQKKFLIPGGESKPETSNASPSFPLNVQGSKTSVTAVNENHRWNPPIVSYRQAAILNQARTVARRAERSIVALSKEESLNKLTLIYINRISDWLFALNRYTNKLAKISELFWKGRG